MKRRFAAIAVVVAFGAGACSSSSTTSSSSGGAAASGTTRTVQVDSKPSTYVGSSLAYFPNAVTVHPGDTVAFHENWTGEPHTVTLGTLVEKGLAAARSVGPNAAAAPPDFASLPVLLPNGPGDANQNAAQPCYLDAGAPPAQASTPCPKVAQPDFNGRQTYYNSGFLPGDSTFSVHLASDIAPGTYDYYCNLHGPSMSGKIVVAAAATAIPSQSDVETAAAQQRSAIETVLAGDEAAAKSGKQVAPVPGNLAGILDQKVQNAGVNEFVPGVIHAKVGQAVSWAILGVHTISFGAAASPAPIIAVAADGSVHLNAEEGSPAPPPSGPPPAGGPPPVINGGSWDGTGQRSTGVVQSFPPTLSTYKLTFTKAGTYSYVCYIHPGMTGQVIVG